MKLYAGQIISDETGAKFVLVPYKNKDIQEMPLDFDGTKARDLRKQRGWSQAQLAQKAKITQATVSHIENGAEHHQGTLESIWRVLSALS